jgi:hypothetical protein
MFGTYFSRIPLHRGRTLPPLVGLLLTVLGGCLVDDDLHDERLRGILGARHVDPSGLRDTGAPPVDALTNDSEEGPPPDDDGDGVHADRDCDDADPSIHPAALEDWGDHGVDNDCDGDVWDPVTRVASATDGLAVGEGFGRAMARWQDCVVVLAGPADETAVVAFAVEDMGDLGLAGRSPVNYGTVLDHVSVGQDGGLLLVEEPLFGPGAVLLSDAARLCDGHDDPGALDSVGRISTGVPNSSFGVGSQWVDDLDGDGREDLALVVVASDGSNSLAIFNDPPSSGDLLSMRDADQVVSAPGLSGVLTVPGDVGDGRASLVLAHEPGWANGVAVQLLEPGLPNPDGLGASTVGVVMGRAGQAVSVAVVHGWTDRGLPTLIARQGSAGAWPLPDFVGTMVLEEAPWLLPLEDPDAEMVNVGDMDFDGRDDLVFGLGDWGVVHPLAGAAVVLGRIESVEAAGGEQFPGFGRSAVGAPSALGGVLVGAPDGEGAVVSRAWPGVR